MPFHGGSIGFPGLPGPGSPGFGGPIGSPGGNTREALASRGDLIGLVGMMGENAALSFLRSWLGDNVANPIIRAWQALKASGGDTPPAVNCGPFQVMNPATQECELGIGEFPGSDAPTTPIMGRYGAGLIPGSKIIDRAVCLRGMQLGDDGICYNKSQITNKERMWPAGRRPLLTGGEMRSISIAARAAGRLARTSKRLQKIGLLKKTLRR